MAERYPCLLDADFPEGLCKRCGYRRRVVPGGKAARYERCSVARNVDKIEVLIDSDAVCSYKEKRAEAALPTPVPGSDQSNLVGGRHG